MSNISRVSTFALTTLALTFLAGQPASAADAKIEGEFAARIGKYLEGKNAAVLLEDGLPTQAVGGGVTRGSMGIAIQNDGAWEQKKFLGIKPTPHATLSRGQVLAVVSTKVKKDAIEIKLNTHGVLLYVDPLKAKAGERLDYQGLDIEFKWIDNAQKPGDILNAYLDGDAAPDGRFRYRYDARPAAPLKRSPDRSAADKRAASSL
ncbi:MAG: hypothetical protein MUF51_09685 [Vicinamibacteria bacterium]|nr:hypothetical protein [Vicinamibacteria bacterium]